MLHVAELRIARAAPPDWSQEWFFISHDGASRDWRNPCYPAAFRAERDRRTVAYLAEGADTGLLARNRFLRGKVERVGPYLLEGDEGRLRSAVVRLLQPLAFRSVEIRRILVAYHYGEPVEWTPLAA
jgi:hypothetical protein